MKVYKCDADAFGDPRAAEWLASLARDGVPVKEAAEELRAWLADDAEYVRWAQRFISVWRQGFAGFSELQEKCVKRLREDGFFKDSDGCDMAEPVAWLEYAVFEEQMKSILCKMSRSTYPQAVTAVVGACLEVADSF